MLCTSPKCALRLTGIGLSTDVFGTTASTPTFPFPGPAPVLSPREAYLRALEQERADILAEAYAHKASPSSAGYFDYSPQSASSSSSSATSPPSSAPSTSTRPHTWPIHIGPGPVTPPHAAAYDARGRQRDFVETVRQRQARLEFLRRQEHARRLAARGQRDKSVSAYAIKRLPPPRARPAERVNAAVTIQHAFRRYRAVANALTDLAALHAQITALRTTFPQSPSSSPRTSPRTSPRNSPRSSPRSLSLNADLNTHATSLRTLLAQLLSLARALTAEPATAAHPRVLRAARAAATDLKRATEALERLQADADSGAGEQRTRGYRAELESIEESDDESLSGSLESVEEHEYYHSPALSGVDEYEYEYHDDEEEEEDERDEEGMTPAQVRALTALYAVVRAKYTPPRLSLSPTSSSGSARRPVSRAPSLESVPEDTDEA